MAELASELTPIRVEKKEPVNDPEADPESEYEYIPQEVF